MKYSLPLQETETEGGNTTLTLNTEAWKEHASPPRRLTRTQSKSHNQRPSERLCAPKVENWDIGEQAYMSIPLFPPSLSHTNFFKCFPYLNKHVHTHNSLNFPIWDLPLPVSYALLNAHPTANMKSIN